MRYGRLLLGVAAVGFALAWRLPGLDRRPMHGDEANQAVRTGQLLDEGVYQYDPNDHHGPVLYYSALPFCRATASTFAETNEWNFRLVPVFFSLLTLVLLLGLCPKRLAGGGGAFVNAPGAYAALLLTAASPAMIYFNRFFIQESQLVTFLTGMFLCGYRAAVSDSPRARSGWAAGLGLFAGLAIASKETAVLSFAAAAVALFCVFGFRWMVKRFSWRDWAWAFGSALLVVILFFSSFFTYPQGLYDALFSTVSTYTHRATAVPEHQHGWAFYGQILFWFRYGRGPVWSEAGILFPALVAAVASFCRGGFLPPSWKVIARFLVVYTVGLTLLYSAIPYKTPWCGLSFLHGYLLLAGMGIGVIAEMIRCRIPPTRRVARFGAWTALLVLVGILLWRDGVQAYRAIVKYPADPRNPYVYAHTGTDAMNLVRSIEEAAQKLRGRDTPIAVAAAPSDIWPLPWYLRAYRNVGYWQQVSQIPDAADPSILIVGADQGDVADARFGKGMQANFYGIRPGTLLNLFVPEEKEDSK